MKYAQIPGIDLPVSRLFFGTAMNPINTGANCDELFDSMFELGINTFDTARVYGDAEGSLGTWIRHRKMEGKIVILSKCCHPDAFWNKRVNPQEMRKDLEKSLDKLGVEKIDIYLLHRDDPDQPVGPIMETLNQLHEEGKIGLFGGSNWSVQRLQEANEYAQTHGLLPLSVSSPYFALAEQKKEPWGGGCQSIAGPKYKKDRQWYKDNQMPLVCYSSLASGWLSGKLKYAEKENAASIFPSSVLEVYETEANYERLRRAEKLAADRGVTVTQIAMTWIHQQGLNTFTAVSSHSVERMKLNIASLDLALSPEEIDYLDLREQ